MEAEYSDNEEREYSSWRDIEEEYKDMEDDSWMDKIAAQARQKFAKTTLPQKQQEQQRGEKEKEEEYRRILEEEMQKDKEWRERVREAAKMNESERDEEKWRMFEDKRLEEVRRGDVPWPSGPPTNILGIKENLPFSGILYSLLIPPLLFSHFLPSPFLTLAILFLLLCSFTFFIHQLIP